MGNGIPRLYGNGGVALSYWNGSAVVDALSVGSTGNVGIGTTAPVSKLDLQGAVTGKALAIFNETGDQALLTASASGTTKFTVLHNGLVDGTAGGLATFTKAGAISDTDFTDTAVDGLTGFDSTNGRLYIRNGGLWSYIAKTAGFQIPDFESGGLSEGDYLIPYVEKKMSDGAVHGLYQKLDLNKLLATQGAVTFKSTVEFQGPTVFRVLAEFFDSVVFHNRVIFQDKDMAGTATISTYSDKVDVKFTTPYSKPPIVTYSLVTQSETDNTFLPEGRETTLTNVTTDGFTILLDTLALRDYTYDWVALAAPNAVNTKSPSVIQQMIDNQVAPLRQGFEGQAGVASESAILSPTPTVTPIIEVTPFASPSGMLIITPTP